MVDSQMIAAALSRARECFGVPYAIGGVNKDGVWVVRGKPEVLDLAPKEFDCSGFSRWTLGQAGVLIPHGCAAQWSYTTPVVGQEMPLDLGFADLRGGDKIPDHVVISFDGTTVIEARGPQPGKDYGKVIFRPKSVWLAQKGWLGWRRAPFLYT